MAERIGFIGLGNIGRPMATNTLARSKASPSSISAPIVCAR